MAELEFGILLCWRVKDPDFVNVLADHLDIAPICNIIMRIRKRPCRGGYRGVGNIILGLCHVQSRPTLACDLRPACQLSGRWRETGMHGEVKHVSEDSRSVCSSHNGLGEDLARDLLYTLVLETSYQVKSAPFP